MKTKFYWFALLASAALIAQAQGGGHHGGGGGMGGGFAAARPAPARGGAGSSYHSMPIRNFGGGRMIYSGQRFSSVGIRSPSSAASRQHYINSNGTASIGPRQFTPGNSDRGNHLTRFGNDPRLAQGGNGFGRGNGAIENQRNGAGHVRSGSNLRTDWRNHVVAQHSADWQRNWDRSRDHWWHGHRCRFVNGSWFIFDFGFDPWWPYPYDYYADDYYPYEYDPGVYEGDGSDYYGQGAYDSSEQYADSTVASAQGQLARQGYYRGAIDGVFGPETRRAIMRYQGDHGLRVTGSLNTDTVQALGLPRVASN